jgi:hypothetical protein
MMFWHGCGRINRMALGTLSYIALEVTNRSPVRDSGDRAGIGGGVHCIGGRDRSLRQFEAASSPGAQWMT